jgi:hypothetical protein
MMADTTFVLRLSNQLDLMDYKKSKVNEHYVPIKIEAGEHKVMKIPNPFGYELPWLVLAESPTVGIAEPAWYKLGGAVEV